MGLSLGVWAAITAAIAITVAGGLWFVFHKGETSGAAAVTVKVQQRTIEVQRKITDAEAAGPRTPSDVVQRLLDGTF
jgi:hypothetical protein